MTTDTVTVPARKSRHRRRTSLNATSGLGLGIAMIWFSLLVLIPLAAVVGTTAAGVVVALLRPKETQP